MTPAIERNENPAACERHEYVRGPDRLSGCLRSLGDLLCRLPADHPVHQPAQNPDTPSAAALSPRTETKPMKQPEYLVYPTTWKCYRSACRNAAQVEGGYCPDCFRRKVTDMPDRPEIVVLCGSTRFKQAWYDENKRLTYEGKIVLGVGDLDTSESARDANVAITPELKAMLDELHKRKIDLADRVRVLNVGGYIGSSTRSEIEYAEWFEKPIDYLEPIGGTADA